jgi:hypothetical protein
MPYLPYVPSLVPPLRYSQCQNRRFPPTWPVYAPARKLANWLESYASSLDLNVWTSSTVINARPDASGSKWTVAINRPDGERVFKEVRHVVFATGLGSGDEGMKLPVYPGMVSDTFILFQYPSFRGGLITCQQLRRYSRAKCSIRADINELWIIKERRWSLSGHVRQVCTHFLLLSQRPILTDA